MNAVSDTAWLATLRPAEPRFPDFDSPVPANGYRWWYVDALSDDGRHGITLIVFIGSVFSPFYAAARRRVDAEPREHCAVNVALYGPGRRWALSEWGQAGLQAEARTLQIGTNSVAWNGRSLVARIDERSSPLPIPIRGELMIHPECLTDHELNLDAAGDHQWWPVAPASRVEVRLESPALRWSGRGYFDSNRGRDPLEKCFRDWNWSRALTPDGTRIHYDINNLDGSRREIAALVRPSGLVEEMPRPGNVALTPTLVWRMPRETRSDNGAGQVIRTLEDTPFYSRSIVSARQGGRDVTIMHESLSLRRFAAPWVQHLIPYRMRRLRG